jgi:cytosine/adenosine deaminase-related metal-dependent hydrolase
MIAGGARLVNAHTHVYSALAPYGMPAPAAPPTSFLEILARSWWRLDRALDEPSLIAAAELYVAEAAAAGCAGLVDHHESPRFIDGSLEPIADACLRWRMPALLCYGATERNGGRDEARRGLAECARFVRSNRRPHVRGAIGLHASFTVSDDTIAQAAGLARELGAVLHLHIAEDAADVADARARGYAGVIDRLARLDALVPGSILAHGVHLTATEVRACDERGVWLVQNPRSNRGNRVGYPRALATSARVALGTDGYPAVMADEVAALAAEAAAHDDDPARAEARPAAGATLLAERLGGAPPPPDDLARTTAAAALDDLRARARAAAGPVWARMQALP